MMTRKKQRKSRRGAAAYYIVAFSTLILVVIATSFALVMLSEMTRSSNDELSQSAYDAALIGVEDAKIAFANYKRCVDSKADVAGSEPSATPTDDGKQIYTVNCPNIRYWVEKKPDCRMVGKILGRAFDPDSDEVDVGGTKITGSKDTSTNQAYTCSMIHTDLSDYRSTLTASKTRQTMRAEVDGNGAKDVNKLRIKWHSVRSDVKITNTTYNFDANNDKVAFKPLGSGGISSPPTLEVQILQTGNRFKMSDFDVTASGQTNRATLFLVPTAKDCDAAKNADGKNYIGTANSSCTKNTISKSKVVNTNKHGEINKPFVVYCDPNTTDEFYCSVEVTLPEAIGGGRSNNTFMISVSIPYQTPDTDFAIELICKNDGNCGSTTHLSDSSHVVALKNTQVAIDSTGRANDLYRRVEVRLEVSDTSFGSGFPNYALQILGGDGSLDKTMEVTYEDAFYF